MTTIRDIATPEQITELSAKYSGKLLSRADMIDIFTFIGTERTLQIAEILKRPPPKYHGPNKRVRKGYKGYYSSSLYKLMEIM